ncbi:MAG: cytochrome c biogenesis protein ResB, partial [Anaerolineae bacterium]
MAEQTERASRFEPLSALWRVLAAPQTLLILVGLLAFALAASSVIPQMPASHASDPQAWLAMQAGVWAQAGDIFHLLGIFNIAGSFWFRAFLALAGLCLFVRMADSLELTWRVTRREPWTRASLAAWGSHPPRVQLTLPTPPEGAMERLGTFLARQGYATRSVSDLPVPAVVAIRRGLVLWTRPLAYGSLLLALVCLTVVSAWGWQGEPWRPLEGERHSIGPDETYSVRLDSFGTVSDGGEQTSEYASTVTWLEGDSVVRQGMVGAGQTLAYAGITLRQVGYVPVVRMRGWDGDDQPLMLETEGDVLSMTGEAEIRFDSAADAPLVLVPNEDLFLMLSFEQDCEGRG